MDDAASPLRRRVGQNLHGVRRRVPQVENTGQVRLAGDSQLPQQPLLLIFFLSVHGLVASVQVFDVLVVFLQVVVVEADFPDGHNFRVFRVGGQIGHEVLVRVAELRGVEADGRIDVGPLIRQGHGIPAALGRSPDIDDRAHVQFRQIRKKFGPVRVELPVFIVCVCLKYLHMS